MSEPTKSPRLRNVLFTAVLTLAALCFTSTWVAAGHRSVLSDLPQDYASARAWLDGDSPYRPLGQLLVRYGFPPPPPDVMVGTNPHPPVAVLLTVPYVGADFETALTWVRWTQLVAIAITWALCFALFRPQIPWWVWALAGGLFGLWAPVWQGLAWGQPVGLLALATVGLWWLARAERPFAFGVLLACATLVRPFLAMQIVLVCGWSARQQGRAVAGMLAGGLVPFALLGIWPWEWYRLASDAGGYIAGCGSLPGVLHLSAAGGQVLFAVTAGALAWLRWRGLEADRTAALAAVSALLVYPLAWFQYDTALIAVLGWLAARVRASGDRTALWGMLVYLLARAVPDMIATPGGTGLVEALAHAKSWLQVAARAVLLGVVVAAARSDQWACGTVLKCSANCSNMTCQPHPSHGGTCG